MNMQYLVYAVYRLEPENRRYKYLRSYPHLNSACAYCDSLRSDDYFSGYYLIRCFDIDKGPVAQYVYNQGLLSRRNSDEAEFYVQDAWGYIYEKDSGDIYSSV